MQAAFHHTPYKVSVVILASLFLSLISFSIDLTHKRSYQEISTTLLSIHKDAYAKCSSGVRCILTQRRRSAVRGGQGRRLRKQMGCKVGSDAGS